MNRWQWAFGMAMYVAAGVAALALFGWGAWALVIVAYVGGAIAGTA